MIGPFSINYNYKHYGKSFDYAPTVQKVDSTDIMNLSISKITDKGIFRLHITNLTDENYQRPDTYNQEGRRIELSFRHKY